MKNKNTAGVIEQFAAKRRRAEAESESRLLEIHALLPEIAEIDRELFSTSVNVMAIAMSGEDVELKLAELRRRNEEMRAKREEILSQNGYPADYTAVHFECDKCCDTGFVGVEMCDCLRRAVTAAAFEDSGLGNLVEVQGFDNFSLDYYDGSDRKYAETNFAVLKGFAENFRDERGKSFILMGATGLGKTHLSTAVAKTVIESGYRVVYKTVQDIMSDFEANRFRGTENDEELAGYFDCDLLIVDDLGCEVSNQFTLSCVYNIVNSRINSRKSTIINTNLSQSELRSKYADRITSRIFGEYRPLLFSGRDIRAQKLSRK